MRLRSTKRPWPACPLWLLRGELLLAFKTRGRADLEGLVDEVIVPLLESATAR